AAARAQVVLSASPLSSPHLYRTAAHGGGPLGTVYAAAGPAPCRPRYCLGRHGRRASGPPVGPGAEPECSAALPPPTACPLIPDAQGARGGRFRPAETPDLWHSAH